MGDIREINLACGHPTGAVAAVKQLGMDKCQELIDRCDCMWFGIFGGIGAT